MLTATTNTYANGSAFEATALSAAINAAYAQGCRVEVNGRKVKAPYWTNRPAEPWKSGTVSVSVEPRTRGAQSGTVWVKRGQSATVTVTEVQA